MFAHRKRRSARACLSDREILVMRVCIVTTELLGVGASGGNGVGARAISRHLAARSVEVGVIVPRRQHEPVRRVEDIPIRSYNRSDLRAFAREVRAANADVYHYVQASLGAWLAQRVMPDRAHVVECVDPRDWSDWRIDFRLPTHSPLRLFPSFVYFGTRPAALSARRADAIQVPARFLQAKVRRLYGLSVDPHYAPMPFDDPIDEAKSPSPLVAFVGRIVPRKRPEIVIDLAQRFPKVSFVIVGGGSDSDYAGHVHRRAAAVANVTFTDFIDQAAEQTLFSYLSKAWVLINTSAREGLPLTFIEAAGHRCAILSERDPDGYASKFGYHAADGDFARGLEWLLADNNWRPAGERGHAHVMHDHNADSAIKRQLSIYDAALVRSAKRGITRAKAMPSSDR
jgi:glycosyltransferase involved in cell wall biosynthesis